MTLAQAIAKLDAVGAFVSIHRWGDDLYGREDRRWDVDLKIETKDTQIAVNAKGAEFEPTFWDAFERFCTVTQQGMPEQGLLLAKPADFGEILAEPENSAESLDDEIPF